MRLGLAIVPFAAITVMTLVAQQIDAGSREVTGYCLAVASAISAAFAIALGLRERLQNLRPVKTVELRTGREFLVRHSQSLFGIPPFVWAGLHIALAAVFLYLGLR